MLKSLLEFPSSKELSWLTLATPGTVPVSDPREANVSIITRENRVSTNNLTQPDRREEPKAAAGLLARVLNKLDFHLKWYLCCGKTLESNFRIHIWPQETQIRKWSQRHRFRAPHVSSSQTADSSAWWHVAYYLKSIGSLGSYWLLLAASEH